MSVPDSWDGFVNGLDAVEDPRIRIARARRLSAAQRHSRGGHVRYLSAEGEPLDRVQPSRMAQDARIIFQAERTVQLRRLEPFDASAERVYLKFT